MPQGVLLIISNTSKKLLTGVRHDQKDPLRLGPTSFGPIPELPWQVEGLLTVVSTVKKLNFRNVGFEPQKLTFAGIFSSAFMCSYRRKFSPSIIFFVH